MRQTPASIRGATAPLQALSQVWSTSTGAWSRGSTWGEQWESVWRAVRECTQNVWVRDMQM